MTGSFSTLAAPLLQFHQGEGINHNSRCAAPPQVFAGLRARSAYIMSRKKSLTMAGGRAREKAGGKVGRVLAATVVGSWTVTTFGVAPGAAARFCSKVGMTVFCNTSCSRSQSLLASGKCLVRSLSACFDRTNFLIIWPIARIQSNAVKQAQMLRC